MSGRAFPRSQRGQSLIAIMVGLLISLLTIAAMMAVYKTVVDVSGNASRTTVRDGQVSLAMLAAQVEMQQAGYGLSPTEAAAQKLHVSSDGDRVVWRFRSGSTASVLCAGVEIVRTSTSGGKARGVYSLESSAECTDPAAWTEQTSLLLAAEEAFFVPVGRDGNPLDDEVGANLLTNATFRKRDGSAGDSCSLPYAQQLRDSLPSSQAVELRAGGAGSAVLFSVCLPNIEAVATGSVPTNPDPDASTGGA